jgi:hypothetical protein
MLNSSTCLIVPEPKAFASAAIPGVDDISVNAAAMAADNSLFVFIRKPQRGY